MTALRFQTGGIHQTYPASLRGSTDTCVMQLQTTVVVSCNCGHLWDVIGFYCLSIRQGPRTNKHRNRTTHILCMELFSNLSLCPCETYEVVWTEIQHDKCSLVSCAKIELQRLRRFPLRSNSAMWQNLSKSVLQSANGNKKTPVMLSITYSARWIAGIDSFCILIDRVK